MERPAICAHFEQLPDPRVVGRCDHDLLDIIVISVLAVICGADGWEEIAEFGETRESWLRGFLPLRNGVPGKDTYRRVFAALDSAAFHRCFMAWAHGAVSSTEGKLIAIDGKTVRRSFATEDDKKPLHLVSAWCAENQVVLGQTATHAKSNEITAIPELLELVNFRGATVTIDAMGCQRAIADKIVQGGGDYIFGLKGNQGSLSSDTQEFFRWAENTAFKELAHDVDETVDGGHGRIEVRRCFASDDIAWLAQRDRWAGLRTLIMIETERTAGEKTSHEKRYYISSLPADAAILGARIRAHWGIENGLHWVLDMAFDEDRCRIRRGHAPDNFSLLRKIAVNLLKNENSRKRGIERKRKRAGWDPDYLLTVLRANAGAGT